MALTFRSNPFTAFRDLNKDGEEIYCTQQQACKCENETVVIFLQAAGGETMLTYLLFGATYGFACAVQPGPFQTFLISRTMSKGWKSTLPAALAPLISDGPIIALTLVVLSRLPTAGLTGLRLAGGVFLLYLALGAYKTWRRYEEKEIAVGGSTRQSLLSAALVNLLNPNPYLGWSLVMGPMLRQGWHEAPVNGIVMINSFYLIMIASLAGIILLFGAARHLGSRVCRALVGASAIALGGFGVFQLCSGFRSMIGG